MHSESSLSLYTTFIQPPAPGVKSSRLYCIENVETPDTPNTPLPLTERDRGEARNQEARRRRKHVGRRSDGQGRAPLDAGQTRIV